jgi:hypothetical protein
MLIVKYSPGCHFHCLGLDDGGVRRRHMLQYNLTVQMYA